MGRLCNHHEITVLDSRMSYTHRTDHPMHDGATAPVGVCNNFLLHDSTSLPIQHLAFDAPLPPSPLAGLMTGPRPRGWTGACPSASRLLANTLASLRTAEVWVSGPWLSPNSCLATTWLAHRVNPELRSSPRNADFNPSS
jgi:hypothetical protein